MDRIASPKVAGYLFVAPFVIYFLIFFLYPICETFYTSLRQQVGFAPPKFAGLANYKLLKNEYFFTAVVLVVFCCWKWMGVNIVYYLSALQSIPKELYEAAEIDGANAIQRFFKVTVPSVKPTIIYVLTISIYGGFSMFAEAYTLFNSARTPGDIGATIVSYMYAQGFNRNNFGLASAAGIVLLLTVMILNVIQLKFTGMLDKEGD